VTQPAARRRPGRPPAEESRDRIDVIVRVARRRFAQQGFDGTALSAVAGDAEISLSALYHYVKTKQELYELVFDQTLEGMWDGILGIYEAMPTGDGFAGRMVNLATAIRSSTASDSKSFLATTPIEAQRYPELASLLARRDAMRDRVLHIVFDPLLADLKAVGIEPDRMFGSLKLLFSGWANESHLYPAHRDANDEALTQLTSLLDRLLADATSAPRARRAATRR
jgi:AcrR family transcriptional regulator